MVNVLDATLKNKIKRILYNLSSTTIIAFWFMDLCNFPFMQIFDTVYQINGWAWFAIYIFLVIIKDIIKT